MNGNSYILAVSKPWVMEAFLQLRPRLPGEWVIVTATADLHAALAARTPRYIFFPHWSERVSEEVTSRHECICFHMTDVPYGRGGSPLQNLIIRGHAQTMLTALRMTQEVDAGPVYAQRPLGLQGSAAEIFARAAPLVCELIEWMVAEEPQPKAQKGEPTFFKRRKPGESLIPGEAGAEQLYNHIRMLDAPDYPRAFCEHGDWRLEFHDAERLGDHVEARVTFLPKGEQR